LPIILYTPKVFEQKIDNIHHNPVSKKWTLVKDYVECKYSSVRFYEEGEDIFGILTRYEECV
jgi:hypothetical protein